MEDIKIIGTKGKKDNLGPGQIRPEEVRTVISFDEDPFVCITIVSFKEDSYLWTIYYFHDRVCYEKLENNGRLSLTFTDWENNLQEIL